MLKWSDYRVCAWDARVCQMHVNVICSTFSQHHISTTMTGIKETLADIDKVPSDDEIPWQRIADKHGIVRSTLMHDATGETHLQEEATTAQQELSSEQEEELVKYMEALTDWHLPPMRQMIQNFASEIAHDDISES